MKVRLQDKFIAALVKRGEQEVKRTAKYIVFTRQLGGYYYIGKSGSLRHGQTVAASIPCSAKFKKELLTINN